MMGFVILLALIGACGLVLGYASVRFKVEGDPLAEQIERVLPQTQCGQCGYPGCAPYARAMAKGEAPIHLCVPGGRDVVDKVAELLGVEPPSEDEAEIEDNPVKEKAFIIEADCIGCTRCIQACPVDAILGASRHMHTIIESECTGCELCVPACPVSCIIMREPPMTVRDWAWPAPPHAAPIPAQPLPAERVDDAHDDANSAGDGDASGAHDDAARQAKRATPPSAKRATPPAPQQQGGGL